MSFSPFYYPFQKPIHKPKPYQPKKIFNMGGVYVEYWGDGPRTIWHGRPYQLEHRIIAEKVLGRTLKSNEVVHHINHNNQDNRNSNLLICESWYHTWLHWQERYKKAGVKPCHA